VNQRFVAMGYEYAVRQAGPVRYNSAGGVRHEYIVMLVLPRLALMFVVMHFQRWTTGRVPLNRARRMGVSKQGNNSVRWSSRNGLHDPQQRMPINVL
jgi:hypothetical protein